MTRHTIDYGIDLGTTNSAIARADNGQSTIFKSQGHQKDTTPSIVHFDRRGTVRVGDDAKNPLRGELFERIHSGGTQRNTFLEFKRTMGTDTRYASSNVQRELTSEDLSAEVLKTLRAQVLDDAFKSVVITVPARFQQHQIDATQRAAEAAGFEYCELLQEPIAASLAYGIDSKSSDGRWLVFDFGGGTFDAALMTTDGGLMRVIDTAGDEHLGGKNIDFAIVDYLLLPYVEKNFPVSRQLADGEKRAAWRELLKVYAEEAKIGLATKDSYALIPDPHPRFCDDSGKEIEIDFTISLEDFETAVRPIMQRAVDISTQMLRTNRMAGRDLSKVVLVGGPTFSQTLRRLVASGISEDFAVGVDPMTAVARGAAFYASLRQQPSSTRTRDTNKVALKLSYPASTVETEEPVGVLIERAISSHELPHDLYIEVRRVDGGWSSGRMMVSEDAAVVSVVLEPNRANAFRVTLFDGMGNALPCDPSQFSILAGLRAPSATVPFDVCVGALSTTSGRDELIFISGLQKNQTLPAKGKGSFRTQKDIRPGMEGDVLKVPLYQGDPGSRPEYNNPLMTFRITGDDLPQFLPGGSEVEVTLSVDTSRRIALSVFFPYLDASKDFEYVSYTQPDPATEQLERQIDSLQERIASLHEAGFIPENGEESSRSEIEQLAETLDAGKLDSDTRRQVMERLRELARRLDEAEKTGEWPAAERQLNEALERFDLANTTNGTPTSRAELASLQSQATTIIGSKRVDLAKALVQQVWQAHFDLISQDPGYWMSRVKRYDDLFDAYTWSNPLYARQILDSVKQQIFRGTATLEVLEAAVRQLAELLPDSPEGSSESDNDVELLRK
jgi:molecular chaperone DnaK